MDPIGSILRAVLPYVIIGGTVLGALGWAYWHVYDAGKLAQALQDQPKLTAAATGKAASDASMGLQGVTSGVTTGVTQKEIDIDRVVQEAIAAIPYPKPKPTKATESQASPPAQESPFSSAAVTAYLAAILRLRNCPGSDGNGDRRMCNATPSTR